MTIELALKIDVDTERGTVLGVPNLMKLFKDLEIPATFYFSFGPDNTGRAIKRFFSTGFLNKCIRTNVIKSYGWKTLVNGILWPGRVIGNKHFALLAKVENLGFEVGIHAYDHQNWHNNLLKMTTGQILDEFEKAVNIFRKIYAHNPETAAAPGWQFDQRVLKVYEFFDLKYVSDCRGYRPFYPKYGEKVSRILEIPTTLPTLDELLVNSKNEEILVQCFMEKIRNFNVLTLHAELEGLNYQKLFYKFLVTLRKVGVQFITLSELVKRNYKSGKMVWGNVDNRGGKLAKQE